MAVTDLVLEGGGAKLPGLVGAVNALTSADYSIHRIAETSAGAIVGALTTAGIPPESLIETVLGKDFTDFEDLNPASGLVPWLGKIQGLLFHKGMYLGTALHDFLDDILTSQGIRTWGDLRLDDPDSALPPGAAVPARRHRLRRLPRPNAATALGLPIGSRCQPGFSVGRRGGLRLCRDAVLLPAPITASGSECGRR